MNFQYLVLKEYAVGDKILMVRRSFNVHIRFLINNKDEMIYTLTPLSPNQGYKDQIQLKKSYEEEQYVSVKVKE
ncbi:hypothetical protein SADUNF_Sadunf02G0127700 [Salix dunnii]|uniref:Uncharacterized protein n=1 Tax=Salix dunnii TaxID=1413687 RepID=A0A835N7E2_9ROSI|nr:hypothetical protein SADUNF_Sadunf02G0127700 [Salix dunnii]